MKKFFTSDTHFGHTNILRYCNRPFENIEDMNNIIIKNWNEVVGKEDIVYHLGDFSFKNSSETKLIRESLNGKIYLCLGSHDKGVKKSYSLFDNIQESYFIQIEIDGKTQQIFMSHYLHKIWPMSHYGSWCLFGHSHGGMDEYAEKEGKLIDVGVDSHNFKPWNFDEIDDIMKTRPLNFNDLRRRKKNESMEEV